MTPAKQLRFLYVWRREFAKMNRNDAVAVLTALIASVQRAQKFTRERS